MTYLIIIYTHQFVLVLEQLDILSSLGSRTSDETRSICYELPLSR